LSHLREYHEYLLDALASKLLLIQVIVAGELDVYTVPELEEVLMPMRQEGTHDIHVNVTNVSLIQVLYKHLIPQPQ
jgi:anti-anti-sigma regulatory factor